VKKWVLTLALALGLGAINDVSFGITSANTREQNAQNPIAVLQEKVPWGATPVQLEATLGAADYEEAEILSYRVTYQQIPMLLSYHFDETGHLFGTSLTYPRPSQPETGTGYLTLVSEYGEPAGYTREDKDPVWLLEDNLLMTIVTGDETQSILLIRRDLLENPTQRPSPPTL
jgi:hypothetical protein